MSILAGVAMLASLALVAPAAHATHDDPDPVTGDYRGWPPAAEDDHENPPVVPLPGTPTALCAVTGGVNTAEEYEPEGGPQHDLNLYGPINPVGGVLQTTEQTIESTVNGIVGGPVPAPLRSADPVSRNVWNNPAHSHFEFNSVLIVCVGNPNFDVEAYGGNDGHYLDIWDLPALGNPSVPCIILGDDNKKATTTTTKPPVPTCDIGGDVLGNGDLHVKNEHHGSVNESGWSHSDGYATTCPAAADDPSPDQANKGCITNGDPLDPTDSGWVKYTRVGAGIIAWGKWIQEDGPNEGKRFWTALVLTPTGVCGPGAVGNPDPGGPFDPLSCAFVAGLGPVPQIDSHFLLTGLAVLYDN